MFSLPFSRGRPRLPHQSSSQVGNSVLPTEELKKGSWVLAQPQPTDVRDHLDQDLQDLNKCLALLAEVFPDVQSEVFREMLLNVSKESRVEVVTEHLLKDKGKWVRGRYKTQKDERKSKAKEAPRISERKQMAMSYQETFRSAAYRQAVKAALYSEFKGLSHASIKAVLAEHNSSYSDSRPVLQQLSSKSWRFYLTNLWSKKAIADDAVNHPLINWQAPYGDEGPRIPYLRQTDSHELNHELYQAFIAPLVRKSDEKRMENDNVLARELNEAEAARYDALFECECCYSLVVFEELAACSSGVHLVCFQCVRYTLNEALFGQGWAKTVDVNKMAIHCLAPSTDDCNSCIPNNIVKRALMTSSTDGLATYRQFTDRIAQHNLDKCKMPLLRCPFCSYAEVDETPGFEMAGPHGISSRLITLYGYSKGSLVGLVDLFAIVTVMSLLPILHIAVWILSVLCGTSFGLSHKRILRRRTGLRFECRSPDCEVASCSVCLVRWQDPHICYETAKKSLRHAIEAATTAVVKRTCPRCNTSFVKSTGCNKLVCPCGYSMCYICRSPIGQEGYAHFCQHFRLSVGRCQECDRCDLYKVEDEELIIKRAAEQAERDWRAKQGQPAGTDKLGLVKEQVLRGSTGGRWDFDDVLDGFVDLVLA
ncbi:hypothetical protein BDZ85DRAFT_256857 [Elsinoe ampelina]|uniref:RING-type domain-containing protein n=1 Tax=Elsinoe ampelina TaxID=302913 RepID=A0A6A6GNB9_9PEZI|nr:hypothetical protein BDZ85DRAFT_256857 [Elsinoe ampelina]